jgi:hypothetical protein
MNRRVYLLFLIVGWATHTVPVLGEARGISNVTIQVQDNNGTYTVRAIQEIIEKNGSPDL